MAPQLWMLRHGEAVPHGSKPDDERELTPRGRGQAEAAGRALAALGEEIAACYSSPKVRAWETATLACAALNLEPIVEHALADGFARSDASALLRAHPGETILIVGHEPTFSQVVHDFTGARIDFKKGGLAGLAKDQLIVLLRPREIDAIR